MSTLPYTLWQRKNKQWNTSRKHFGAKMSPLLIAQIFYLLTLTSAAPPDLVADVERVEVIAGAKDILLPCRSKVFLVSLQENNLTILVAWSIIFSNNIFTLYSSFFFFAFHFKININKVTTRWEGPKNLSYYKQSLGNEKRWASVTIKKRDQLAPRFGTSVCWTPITAFKPS